ncbi:hypothetical protein JTB14_029792 [Gonioctena quinquepunctata]|nr:hypothetical protein JTB14_029792 [Gonioctena quinquepunctata]
MKVIFDWGTGAKTTTGQNKSSRNTSSKITALEWINSQDIAMLMVASDDGGLRLWRPNVGSSREPSLISAWQAFNELKSKYSGIVMTWEQLTQTLISAGDSRLIRLWDAERELIAYDLNTGTDSSVTCIDSTFSSICHGNYRNYYRSLQLDDDGFPSYHGPKLGMCVVGCVDGSVRLFDRRCSPSEARVKVWMDHIGSVLTIQLRDNLVVSGSGSINQFINIYTLKGNLLNTIRLYEGFMPHRIGPVTCLNYHPHKVALAAVFCREFSDFFNGETVGHNFAYK